MKTIKVKVTEKHREFDFHCGQDWKDSEIFENKRHYVEKHYKCKKCGSKIFLNHNKTFTCECGIEYLLQGAAVFVTATIERQID